MNQSGWPLLAEGKKKVLSESMSMKRISKFSTTQAAGSAYSYRANGALSGLVSGLTTSKNSLVPKKNIEIPDRFKASFNQDIENVTKLSEREIKRALAPKVGFQNEFSSSPARKQILSTTMSNLAHNISSGITSQKQSMSHRQFVSMSGEELNCQ